MSVRATYELLVDIQEDGSGLGHADGINPCSRVYLYAMEVSTETLTAVGGRPDERTLLLEAAARVEERSWSPAKKRRP